MNKKYELLTNETVKTKIGETLYRIRALKDFGDVKAGDLGGFIESENNLSHKGDCWVFGNARIYDNARVYNDARVFGDACVNNNAWVYDDARVYNDAWVSGDAQVYDNAWVSGNARVYNNARVFGNAWVSGNAQVFGDTRVSGDAHVYSNAQVSGNAQVSDNARVSHNAKIINNNDFIYLKGFGSKNRSTTFYITKDNGINVVCGCFNGTLDEFISKVKETHGTNNKYAKEYLLLVEVAKVHFDLE